MKIKKWVLYVYYLVFLLVYVFWKDFDNVTNAFVRIASMLAIILPCYFFNRKMLPAVMMLFLTLCTHGLTSAYLPKEPTTYIVVLLVGLIVFKGVGGRDKRTQTKLYVLLAYMVIINAVTSFELVAATETIFIFLLLTYFIDFSDEVSFDYLSISFIVCALALSVSLIINEDKVMTSVGGLTLEGAERAAFRDINYSSCVVSLGMIAALIELLRQRKRMLINILSIATLMISTLALALNASRASFVSVAVAGLIILWFSRTKNIYKVFLSVAVFVGLYYLYTNEVFNIVMARFVEGDGTGAGRTLIWQHKIEDFSRENLGSLIFGMGHTIGREFDIQKVVTLGFHNDFLAFLVCYGIIGFIIFIFFFFHPLHYLSKTNTNKITVVASIVGLFIVCMTLEPFAAGRIPYYFFWIYIIWLAKLGVNNIENKA